MPTTRIARLGCSKNSAASSASASLADVTTTHGTARRRGLLRHDRRRAGGDRLRHELQPVGLQPGNGDEHHPGRHAPGVVGHARTRLQRERASLTCAGRSCGGIARAKARNNSPTMHACGNAAGPRRKRLHLFTGFCGGGRRSSQSVAESIVKRAARRRALTHDRAVSVQSRTDAQPGQHARGIARVHSDEVREHRGRFRGVSRERHNGRLRRSGNWLRLIVVAASDENRSGWIQRRRHAAMAQRPRRRSSEEQGRRRCRRRRDLVRRVDHHEDGELRLPRGHESDERHVVIGRRIAAPGDRLCCGARLAGDRIPSTCAVLAVPRSTTPSMMVVSCAATSALSTRRTTLRGTTCRTPLRITARTRRGSSSSPPLATALKAAAICSGVTLIW